MSGARRHEPGRRSRRGRKTSRLRIDNTLSTRASFVPRCNFSPATKFTTSGIPLVGPEFNHGYLVGVNANWHVFDGFATKGKLQATRARREAAVQALEAARRSVASEVRSAFFDLDQADRVLKTETKNVQTADESLEIAKTNLGRRFGHAARHFASGRGRNANPHDATQRDLFAQRGAGATDLRLRRIRPGALDFNPKMKSAARKKRNEPNAVEIARPPKKLSKQ